MYGIFMENFVMLKLYTGLKLLLALTVLAWGYLLCTEKDKRIRLVLVTAPVLILALFLLPAGKQAFVAFGLDGETYYRILWTIPMGLITVYGACRLFEKHYLTGLVIASALFICCGSLVYRSINISRAENPYHLPAAVVEICDLISNHGERQYVKAVMPPDLIHYVRQYDAHVSMPYGREMLVDRWEYYNAVYEAMEGAEVVDVEQLLQVAREEYCQYFIFDADRKLDQDPEECGLVLAGRVEDYLIYEDPVSMQIVESWQEYYKEN